MKSYEEFLKTPIRQDRKPLQNLLPLSQPLRILIDPCDICNFKCSYCFQSYDKSFKGNIMSNDLFQMIVGQLQEFENPINVIHLYGLGEPMLNPNLPDFIRILKDKNAAKEIAVTSNGSRLEENYSKRLVNAGLNRLSISLNGICDKHFEKITEKEVSFDEIYRQIKYFYEIRKQCHLHIKINGDYFTEEEKYRFVNLFKDYSDTLNIDHVVNVWSGIKVTEKARETIYGGEEEWKNREKEEILCPQMFYELLIHSDGSVSPCCVDYNYKQENLGNVKTQSLKEIWNGFRLLDIRRNALKEKSIYRICKTCTYPREAATVDLSPYREMLLEKY